MTDPYIVGWAHSAFGKSEAPDTEALMAEVTGPALAHAGVEAEDVDGIFVGVFNNGFSDQDFQGALVGMGNEALARVPATRYENACATGSAALHGAMDFIASGRGKIALVVGAEKMTATPGAEVGDILLGASYRAEEAGVGGGFAGLFGQIAGSYFQRYGDQSEALAMIAAKNHHNGMQNPLAHMQRDFDVAFCNTVSEKNPLVAGPLRRTASGLTLDDLSLVETHDCFTVAELLEYEAMGLTEPGQGSRAIREGWTAKDGRLPVNPSGGLKSKGHPIGATGVSMHVMAAMQLMGEAGGMQIPDAELAGVFNMGGAAVASYASILERVA